MLLGTITKQPADLIDFDVDFREWLTDRANDTILSINTSVDDLSLTLVEVVNRPDAIGVVKQWIAGGSDGGLYKVTVRVTTTAGRVKEVEVRVRVRDF